LRNGRSFTHDASNLLVVQVTSLRSTDFDALVTKPFDHAGTRSGLDLVN